MKVLSPTDVKDKNREAESFQVRTLVDLTNKILGKNTELNDLSARIESMTKAGNRQVEELAQRASDLRAEIEVLKEERREAMRPVDELVKLWEGRIGELDLREGVLDGREQALDEKHERQVETADSLHTWQDTLSDREKAVEIREKGADRQERGVAEMTKNLNERIISHSAHVDEVNEFVKSKNSEFTQREHALKVREEQVFKEWKEIGKARRELKSAYDTLERTKKRLSTNE